MITREAIAWNATLHDRAAVQRERPSRGTTTERKGCLVLLLGNALLIGAIFLVGDVLECEFPYFLTLHQVAHARTVHGQQAREVIARHMAVAPDNVHFHRCSLCKYFDHNFLNGMIRVQIVQPDGHIFVFAYSRDTHVLHPADRDTAKVFPELGSPASQWTW